MVEFLDGLERKHGLRHQVNRCRETLRAIFAFAVERELIAVNPVIGVSKRKVEFPRDRTLSRDELASLWRAINRLPELPRAYFQVVLLTGARRNEVGGMAWSELDLDAALWRLPADRNKSAWSFEIPLPSPVVETLRTGLAELGISFEVAERVLNHAMPGLEAVYNHHNYLCEKRRALALWAEHVLAIAEERKATVVALRPAVA